MNKKLTIEELKQRSKALGEWANKEFAKRAVLQFRTDRQLLENIYTIAREQNKPIGTLLRDWIQDRVNRELNIEKPFYPELEQIGSLVKEEVRHYLLTTAGKKAFLNTAVSDAKLNQALDLLKEIRDKLPKKNKKFNV